MAISSLPGNEFTAIASANGELRAKVVIVRLAYSSYVKLIFSDNNKSIIVFETKNIINGMNIVKTESRLSNTNSPLAVEYGKYRKCKEQQLETGKEICYFFF